MAVAKTGAAGSATSATSPLTFSYTVAADADTLVVGAGIFNGDLITVTYAGVSMTEVATIREAGGFFRSSVFRLTSPITGANNVVVTGTGGPAGVTGGAQGFKGVNQTTPVSNSATNSGAPSANPSVAVTSAVGEWTLSNVAGGSALSAPTQNQTWLETANLQDGGEDAAGAASVTHAWTMPSDNWAMAILSLKAAGAAGDDLGTGIVRSRMREW